ncbi:WxL domain-containing protein [Vagococcus intermedius]|uniref:WxL domain-containing protein n=1 Tax=Vagococcus intermedius TaxID=2991418 RepID=A0AAF0CV53_9ENTE|nr:WxL domain-containing protein [Vagococcus intermedius]WEG73600.1 WxL domain-containing protein [Vagococcus intermedius]WEG75684.1 WxL domain-containing protein [Vagococcus intermedius]
MKKTLISTILLSTLVLGGAQAFAADSATNVGSKGTIGFTDGGVDPENPEEPKEPEITDPNNPGEPGEKPGDKPGGTENPNQGSLKVEYVPNFQFNTQKVSKKTERYSATPANYDKEEEKLSKPLFAQVSDLRVKEADALTPWTLTLAASPFDNELAEGSTIELNDVSLISANDESTKLTEQIKVPTTGEATTLVEEGASGLSVVRFGEAKEMKTDDEVKAYKGVQLVVPSKVSLSATKGVEYTTSLTWNLTAGDIDEASQGTPELEA